MLLVSCAVLTGAGCGGGTSPAGTQSVALTGWRAVADAPGISQLVPDLGGLKVSARTGRRALVRNGDAIRSATFTFATPRQAIEARKRGAGDDYQAKLERAFHGNTVGHGPGVALRLRVPRPTGRGSDTVEVCLLARGRRLTIVELLSARGFDPELRDRLLRSLSR
ncbi:MAG: hypothetical protein ACM3QU_13990 [Verrucomicrobiota bacterium]